MISPVKIPNVNPSGQDWLIKQPSVNTISRLRDTVLASEQCEASGSIVCSNSIGKMEHQINEDLQMAQAADIESLYRKYAKRCLAFLASLNIKGADAEDLSHQAWLIVCKTLESKTFEGNFRAWLFQVLRNAAIDQFRKKKPDLLEPDAAEKSFATDNAPDAGLIEAEYQRQIKKCLDRLAPNSKTLMQLRLAGQDYNSIAKRLEIDVTKAHRLFFDVKRSMANCLGNHGDQA